MCVTGICSVSVRIVAQIIQVAFVVPPIHVVGDEDEQCGTKRFTTVLPAAAALPPLTQLALT